MRSAGYNMPIYKNDLQNSIIKAVITCPSQHAPSMIVQFSDDSEQILEGSMVALFIKKYTDSANRGITRTIGHELEKLLKRDFDFLFI